MKFFIAFTVAAVFLASQAIASPAEIIREQRSYGAAAAPSYSAPAAYGPAPAMGPAQTYSYPSPAPTIPCGQALVMSCAPSVAQAPCAASSGYGAPSYGGGY